MYVACNFSSWQGDTITHIRDILLLFLLILLFGTDISLSDQPNRQPIFAAYYCWYAAADGPHGRWMGWHRPGDPSAVSKDGHNPDRFTKEGLRDIPSAAYPLIGPYDSTDPNVVDWHIRLAQAAGIDAFLVDWWGPGTWEKVPGLTLEAFEMTILPLAEKRRFKVAMMDETAQFVKNFDAVKRWAAEYINKYKSSPAYLKIDNRPVYYIYQVSYNPRMTTRQFTELKQYVEQRTGPVYWIFDKIAHSPAHKIIPRQWLDTEGIDAFSFYSTFSNFRAYRYDDLMVHYRPIAGEAHAAGKKSMLPVHPGHNNSRIDDTPYIIPREQSRTLRTYLKAATDAGADYILLTSFNEWPETTVVEPSLSWPDPYLYLKIIAEFKSKTFTQPAPPSTN